MNDNALDGRVAVVTGGSGGLGAAICRALAAEGATVAVGYGGNAQAAQALASEIAATDHSRAQAFGADLSDPAAPAELIASVEQALGTVEILVVNHALAERHAYEDVDAQAFDLTLSVNLRAPFLLAQRVLPGMRERGFGRIVFISSAAAFRGGLVGPHYAASKAGLHGLTHYLAAHTARDGVTVNTVAPGFIETPMLPGDEAQLAETVPVGRVGRPDEIADFILAVVRNGFMTNHVMGIDGGIHPR